MQWEIKEEFDRADRPKVRKLYVDGVKLTKRDHIEYECEKCGKSVRLLVQNFIYKPVLQCRDCQRNESRKGYKHSEETKRKISSTKTGVPYITTYFDFTCPVCGETFTWRKIKQNTKKKYCSRKCTLESIRRRKTQADI